MYKNSKTSFCKLWHLSFTKDLRRQMVEWHTEHKMDFKQQGLLLIHETQHRWVTYSLLPSRKQTSTAVVWKGLMPYRKATRPIAGYQSHPPTPKGMGDYRPLQWGHAKLSQQRWIQSPGFAGNKVSQHSPHSLSFFENLTFLNPWWMKVPVWQVLCHC